MRILLFLVVLAVLPACSRSVAGLTIPARQQFVLGDNNDGAFSASLTNEGDQDVVISIRDKTNDREVRKYDLPAGDFLQVSVNASQAIHFVNTNGEDALVKANISRGVQGMTTKTLDYD